MKSRCFLHAGALGFVVLALSTPAAAQPAGTIQRFVLAIGANAAGADRPKLQYALSDAERFARVLTELGGVPPANETILRQPKVKDLIDAINALGARAAGARRAPGTGRVEVIVYYSGHADEQGLLLGSERYPYPLLRDQLDRIGADVRIAVLDACASGAFTRIKGGRARPAFLVDESSNVRGHAFLTSSAENESAQESDRIRASYFTHFLVSGFRGAADLSGDGKITLNEVYQFASTETLRRTVDSRGGAQHPSYDINLSGTGDVVMTDVRQTTASLVIPEDIDGRFFVRTPAQELVVELYKPLGRRVELGLEPGSYDVRLDREKTSMIAKTKIDDGSRVTLEARQFGVAPLEPTRQRGDHQPKNPLAVSGRNRVELHFGGHASAQPAITSGISAGGFVAGIGFTHWAREDIGLYFSILATGAELGSSVSPGAVFSGATGMVSIPIGVKWNPFVRQMPPAIKPYLAASIGPVIGSSAGSFIGNGTVSNGEFAAVTAGGLIGGGVDFHMGRPFSIGITAGYNWMSDFSRPIGSRDNYSGAEIGITFGFLFGKGTR